MSGLIVQPQTLLTIGPSRQFGANTTAPASGGTSNPIFRGYVTITESTVDALEITQQPVQQGATITDHAFKKPVTLAIQILFGSSVLPTIAGNVSSGLSVVPPQSLASIYQKLLALQNSFQPFNVTTPKRTYANMLFATLGVTTDKKTENVLSINASFQQIITVPIGVTTLNRSQLNNPGSNGATQNAGAKQLQSTLYTGWNATQGLISGATGGG